MVTASRLKEVLHYDPVTGIFRWLVNISTCNRIGDEAGTLRSDGYIRIQIDGERRYASQWAHLYMTGELPTCEIDHEDRSRSNNAWHNLRPATKSQNCANRPRRNSGLPRGVTRNRHKFVAQMRVRGETRYLGIYDTAEEAGAAYLAAAQKEHGEFLETT